MNNNIIIIKKKKRILPTFYFSIQSLRSIRAAHSNFHSLFCPLMDSLIVAGISSQFTIMPSISHYSLP